MNGASIRKRPKQRRNAPSNELVQDTKPFLFPIIEQASYTSKDFADQRIEYGYPRPRLSIDRLADYPEKGLAELRDDNEL